MKRVTDKEMRDNRAALLATGRREVPHGTISTYTNYDCRCEPCRTEASRHRKRQRYLKSHQDPDTLPHGTLTCYTDYGCRCMECRRVSAKYRRDLRKRTRPDRRVNWSEVDRINELMPYKDPRGITRWKEIGRL